MYFVCTTDKPPVDYLVGETIVFTLKLRENGTDVAPDAVVKFKLEWDGKPGYREGAAEASKPVEIKTTLSVPGFVRLTCELVSADGKPLGVKFDGGAGAGIKNIHSATPLPRDYDAFHAEIDRLVRSVKPVLLEKKSLQSEKEGFELFDIKVACAEDENLKGKAPVSGYLTLPSGNAPVRCKVGYKGYGVSYPQPEYEDGTAYLFINAHGFENGREQDYYNNLAGGRLYQYGHENADPDKSYFKFMLVRAIVAARFMTTLRRFNGELILHGGSQGAFQALNTAAHCPWVTLCDITVPWICDTAGNAVGRMRNTSPKYERGLAYYDSANAAKKIKCETRIVAGLGDYTCPPSGITAMYNNLRCKKSITYVQNMIHQSREPEGIEETING